MRQRARAQRAWRKYQAVEPDLEPTTAASAHKAWSDAVDDALQTAEAISHARPADLGELLIQFEVCWWWLDMDDNVLDGSTRRWLGRFRRSLRRLATGK